ncbi:hypothetical protein ACTHGU_20580 [Chitinophagaceae bacterium MMS25-I14]
MKKIIAILTILVFAGCHKNDNKISKATLLGYDLSNCACCGGLIMKFDDNNTYFRVSHLPQSSSINEGTQFPVKVFIEWKPDSNACGKNFVYITSLFRQR